MIVGGKGCAVRARCGWAATGLVALLLVAACSPAGDEAVAGPEAASEKPTAVAEPLVDDPSEAAAAPSTVADAEHSVDPPGKFQSPARTPDILISSAETLEPAMVEEITQVRGVAEVSQMSVGQVVLENRIYDLAVVDPATYRRFTPDKSAQLQEQWDRVAGGELAVVPGIRKRLPADDDGYLPLGSGEDVPTIHVGAYAPQIPTIEMVANQKWGDELGIPEGNALLISTGTRTPQSVQKQVQAIIGSDLAPQMLDIASRLGLDPDVFQTVVPVGSFADAVGTFRYTPIGGGRIAPAPEWVREHIVTETVPILGQVTCNRYMMPQLKAAFAEIVTAKLADEINPDQYAGCYYPRFIAGSTSLSNHSFGTALDMNVPGNLRGTVGEMDRGVVAIFKKWGFAWGGDWRYTDPMHFELSRIVKPG